MLLFALPSGYGRNSAERRSRRVCEDNGNPLDDIRVLTAADRNLKLIMKEGRVYKNELAASR